MDNIVIYRKSAISVAYTDGHIRKGGNFDIWYGYSDENTKHMDMIIDANIIKQEMEEDLKNFDHTCVSVINAQDIFTVMAQIGKMILSTATQNKRTYLCEVIIENCYGDCITVSPNISIASITCIYDRQIDEFYFPSDNYSRIKSFGHDVSYLKICYQMPRSKREILDFLYNGEKSINIFSVSTIDLATGIVSSTVFGAFDFRCITIPCIQHYSHQLLTSNTHIKCGKLHGHSYVCNVTLHEDSNCDNLANIESNICKLLESAYSGECNFTSCENVVNYLSHKLCEQYNIIQIELKETNNIKVIQRMFKSNR